MGYPLVMPPSRLDFGNMSKAESRQFFKWFVSMIPSRLRALEDAVQHSPGFASWTADCTPQSLVDLGSWFVQHVQTRPRTQAEIEAIYAGAPAWFRTVEVDGSELTRETAAVAVDVGMYLGQVFMRQIPTLRWELQLGSKRNVDYGQPVIARFGKLAFNPVRTILTHAYGVVQGKHGKETLKETYDYWSARAT